MASPEGMGEALATRAEARVEEERPGGGGGRDLLSPNMGLPPESSQTRNGQHSHARRAGQRKRLHPRGMEPDDRAEAQIESVQMDEGGGFAICRWISPREEGSVRSGVAIRWAEGGGFGGTSPATVGI